MKARINFYFAAVVALVLILASVPSHATERRDPLIIQDTPQTQAARSSSLVHATTSATKAEPNSARKPKPAGASKTSNRNANSAQDGSAGSKGSK